MRDFDLERSAHLAARAEPAVQGGEHAKPGAGQASRATGVVARTAAGPGAGGGYSPALDVASVLHLQRTAGNASVVQMLADGEEERSPVHDVVGSGGGQPLDEGTRASMETSFGRSFEDVRVHTGGQASQSAEAVGANAYTVGSDVVFRDGQFNPSSPTGQRTLAHELAHVVQQSEGPVDGSPAPGGIRVSDPSDRFERSADAAADRVMSSAASPAAATAQREEHPEEEEVQRAVVQREELPEEEEQES